MEKVQGTGGVLFRARDPKALAEWYRDHLGVSLVPDLPACTTPKAIQSNCGNRRAATAQVSPEI